MTRRQGNNYSGARWAFSGGSRGTAKTSGERSGVSASGGSSRPPRDDGQSEAWWLRVKAIMYELHNAEMDLFMAVEARDAGTATVALDSIATEVETAVRELEALKAGA